ncbi:MAG: DUF4433 domain-containing protein, partial [Candidatus Dadabacteria bacterium]|nr:DUF4433 domain-containing protein [Candidatus Dadabacteria bacterium]
MSVPENPKIYHIVHVDRLPHILDASYILSDSKMSKRNHSGTKIGNPKIKSRRLSTKLKSHPDLSVGDCVPFYFCPRSPMLYAIHKQNEDLEYKGGQDEIIYLEADLRESVSLITRLDLRYAFTTSNAGASNFEDYSSLDDLDKVSWEIIRLHSWWDDQDTEEGKERAKQARQAELLVEERFPWRLVS